MDKETGKKIFRDVIVYLITMLVGAGSTFLATMRSFEIKLIKNQEQMTAMGERLTALEKWKEAHSNKQDEKIEAIITQVTTLATEMKAVHSELGYIKLSLRTYPNNGSK